MKSNTFIFLNQPRTHYIYSKRVTLCLCVLMKSWSVNISQPNTHIYIYIYIYIHSEGLPFISVIIEYLLFHIIQPNKCTLKSFKRVTICLCGHWRFTLLYTTSKKIHIYSLKRITLCLCVLFKSYYFSISP